MIRVREEGLPSLEDEHVKEITSPRYPRKDLNIFDKSVKACFQSFIEFLKEYSFLNKKELKTKIEKINELTEGIDTKSIEEVIYNRLSEVPFKKRLSTVAPPVAKQFSAKNKVDIEKVSAFSNEVMLWECPNNENHKFEPYPAAVNTRTTEYLKAVKEGREYNGCPYCAGKSAIKSESLKILYPEVAEYLEYGIKLFPKDIAIDTSKIPLNSNRKFPFACKKCHYVQARKDWRPVQGLTKIYDHIQKGTSKFKSLCPHCHENALLSEGENYLHLLRSGKTLGNIANNHNISIKKVEKLINEYKRLKIMAKKYSDEELLHIAKKHSSYFTTTRGWDLFAKENNLPRSNLYKKRFGSWNYIKGKCGITVRNNQEKLAVHKEKILTQLSPYKSLISTAKDWDRMAKKENLPLSHTIVYYFGKWDYFKKDLGIYIDKDEATLETQARYIEIAKKHISEFSKSAEIWKDYAKHNGLPTINTYIENFGSWTNAQSLAGVNPEFIKNYVQQYNKDYLIKVAKANISYFTHTSKWERFSKQHGLPDQYVYICAYGSMVEAKRAIGINNIPTRKNYTGEELMRIALDHISYFTTQTIWDNFARENNLPRNRAFANAFGSWRECKQFIYSLSKN